jgi:hypothetical protein
VRNIEGKSGCLSLVLSPAKEHDEMRVKCTSVCLVFSLVVWGACAGDDDDPGISFIDGGITAKCNALAQSGCSEGQKCAFVLDDPATGVGHTDCAEDGTAELGAACEQPEEPGESDSCKAGGSCYQGICHQICNSTVPGSCPGPESEFLGTSCVSFQDSRGQLLDIQLCLPQCDLLAGAEACPDASGEPQGCYLVADAAVCAGVSSAAQVGEPCSCANCCSPGLGCFGPAGQGVCRPYCGPVLECFDDQTPANPTECGCGGCGVTELCIFISDGAGGIVSDRVGVCIAEQDTLCACNTGPPLTCQDPMASM